jgi:hypothetical protein
MADRHFPVRPNLDQLKHQAKDLLHAVRQGDPAATAEFPRTSSPAPPNWPTRSSRSPEAMACRTGRA